MVINQFLIRNSVELTMLERLGISSSQNDRISTLRLSSPKNLFLKIKYEYPTWVSGIAFEVNTTCKYNGSYYRRIAVTNNTISPDLSADWISVSPNLESEVRTGVSFDRTINTGFNTSNSNFGRQEVPKIIYMNEINNINYLSLRYPTVTPFSDEVKLSLFKNITTLDYFHNSMFRYENLPKLTTITSPILFGSNIDNLTQTAYLDLSKCSNLEIINISSLQLFNIQNFQIPENTNKLKQFSINTSVVSNTSLSWFQILSGNLNLNFSNFTELTEMTYVGSTQNTNPLTTLTGFTPPTVSKLTIYRCYKSSFSTLDLSASNLLQTFEFCNNPNITSINLINCVNILTLRVGVSTTGQNIGTTNALTTLTLPSTLNSCTLIYLLNCSTLGSLNLPSLTSCTFLNIVTTGIASLIINSNLSVNSSVTIQSNPNLPSLDLSLATNIQKLYITSNVNLVTFSMPTTHTSLNDLWFYNNKTSSFTFNSQVSNGFFYFYNNPLMTSVNNLPTAANNLIFDTNALLNNSNNLWDTILASNRSTLCIRFCANFVSTNVDLSNMTSLTQYRSSGVNISGNYILPATNVMTRFAASNVLSLNRIPTTLQTLHITTSLSLTSIPAIPSTLWGIYIANTNLTGHLDLSNMTTTSFIGQNCSQIILNNNNLTSVTLPLTARALKYYSDIRMSGVNADSLLGAGIGLSNNPNLVTLNNLVGINHNLKSDGASDYALNVDNTGLDMEFPFGKIGNRDFLPRYINLSSMPSMSLLNLYLSLKNIYDNKILWVDYNSGNGSTLSKLCNLNNTIISTKITLQPFGFILGDNSPVVTPVDGFIQLESWVSGTAYPVNHVVLYSGSYYKRSVITDNNTDPLTNTTDWTLYTLADIDYNNAMREMKHVLELQGQVTSTTLKYRWTITL